MTSNNIFINVYVYNDYKLYTDSIYPLCELNGPPHLLLQMSLFVQIAKEMRLVVKIALERLVCQIIQEIVYYTMMNYTSKH